MQKVQFYINEAGLERSRFDLFKDDEVSITSSIQNVKDVSKVFTDFTKSFAIPASSNNNKIFKHYYNFNIDNGFDARIKVSATIELNNLPFKKGKIKLDGVKIKNGKPYSYNITFFGNTVNLKDIFGDDTFNEIAGDFFAPFNQIYTATTVASTLQSAITVGSYTDAILTPLISNTTRLFFDSSINQGVYSTDGNLSKLGGNLSTAHNTSSTHFTGVYYEELKYAIRLHILIKAIETHYGITFSTDFFNTSNDVYYGLYMWLHKKAGRVFDSNIVETPINTFSIGTYTSTYGGSISVGSDKQILKWNTISGIFLTSITVSLTSTVATPEYTIVLKKNGLVVYEQVIPTDSSSPYVGVLTGYSETSFYAFPSTEEYEVSVKTSSQISFTTDSFITFSVKALSTNVEDITVNLGSTMIATNSQKFIIQENIPEIKIIDFLTSLFKTFNLTAYEEEDGTIKVQTLDDFYNSSIKEWDLTEYLEMDYNVNPSLPFKEIDLGYAGLGSFLAKDHLSRFSQEWGTDEYKYNENDSSQPYDALGGIYKLEPQFEHFKYERLLDNANNTTLTDIQVGWSVNESESAYLGKPLLFYPLKVTGGTEIRFLEVEVRTGGNDNQDLTTYYVPSNSVSLSGATSKKNINFKLEQNEYDFQSNVSFDQTLFNLYYKSYIQKVFNSKNRITKLNGNLPLSFMLTHTLADKIIFNGNKYIINSIKMNMNTGKSDIELLTDIKVANEIFITAAASTSTLSCAISDTLIDKRIFYNLNTSIANGIIFYENESLSIPFNGGGSYYKLIGLNKTIQISSTGLSSNLTSC